MINYNELLENSVFHIEALRGKVYAVPKTDGRHVFYSAPFSLTEEEGYEEQAFLRRHCYYSVSSGKMWFKPDYFIKSTPIEEKDKGLTLKQAEGRSDFIKVSYYKDEEIWNIIRSASILSNHEIEGLYYNQEKGNFRAISGFGVIGAMNPPIGFRKEALFFVHPKEDKKRKKREQKRIQKEKNDKVLGFAFLILIIIVMLFNLLS